MRSSRRRTVFFSVFLKKKSQKVHFPFFLSWRVELFCFGHGRTMKRWNGIEEKPITVHQSIYEDCLGGGRWALEPIDISVSL